jgi:hypothetical protein
VEAEICARLLGSWLPAMYGTVPEQAIEVSFTKWIQAIMLCTCAGKPAHPLIQQTPRMHPSNISGTCVKNVVNVVTGAEISSCHGPGSSPVYRWPIHRFLGPARSSGLSLTSICILPWYTGCILHVNNSSRRIAPAHAEDLLQEGRCRWAPIRSHMHSGLNRVVQQLPQVWSKGPET